MLDVNENTTHVVALPLKGSGKEMHLVNCEVPACEAGNENTTHIVLPLKVSGRKCTTLCSNWRVAELVRNMIFCSMQDRIRILESSYFSNILDHIGKAGLQGNKKWDHVEIYQAVESFWLYWKWHLVYQRSSFQFFVLSLLLIKSVMF